MDVLVTVNRIETSDGVHLTGIIRDLSHIEDQQITLHARREQLARAARLVATGELAASIAHELNQPLTAIVMYAEVCQLMLDSGEPERIELRANRFSNTLKKLSEQALRAGAVNDRVQRFVRRGREDREKHDINGLLKEIEPLVVGDARANGVDLVIRTDSTLPPVLCVGINVQQVVLSLLRNAYDAMLEIDYRYGSRVKLVTRLRQYEGDRFVVVEVADDGPGVRSGLSERLFEPFVSSKPDGIGLGLSSCRSLIREENGELEFENRSPHGATFWFRLPAVYPDGLVESEPQR